MASRRTWIWIVVGVLGAGILILIVIAGAGVYFVTQHIRAEGSTDADAMRAFDQVRVEFHSARPLYELDSADEPHLTRPPSDLPTAATPPTALRMLAWDPERHRLVKISLPFWMLRFGQQRRMAVGSDDHGFDIQRLNLDANELARIGPALIFDFRDRNGVRVLLWTE